MDPIHINDYPTTNNLFSFPSLLFIVSHTNSFPSQNQEKTMFDPPRTQTSHTNNHQDWDFVTKNRILTQTHETSFGNWYSDQNRVFQLRPNNQDQESKESDDSGVCSPPLWKNIPSPPRSPSQPLLGHHPQNYRSLSPNSRQQAIARGQWELMEMVKNMPESSYELSLKDLVEYRPGFENQSPQEKNNDQSLHRRGGVKVKRQESKGYERNMMRSGSFDNKGLFLNMFFPFSLNSKKKKKSFASNTSGKVSPKPEVVKSMGERDWWKKKFTGSSDSDSSRTSNNSSSTATSGGSIGRSTAASGGSSSHGSRKKNRFVTGCWPFLLPRRSKN